MLRVGLSGGIGSGKSTVSARLRELGAVIVDADLVAREVVAPGSLGLAQVAERFGDAILTDQGELDRAALGQVVFADEQARRDLEAITHPLIHQRSAELFAAAPADAIVVHDIPLLVELGTAGAYALTIIVDVPQEERLRRLVELRGMPEEQARARIAAQASDAQRQQAADILLDNSGSVEDLYGAIDRLWHERLVPFERAIAEQVPARRPAELSIIEPRPEWPQEAARILDRLRRALGEQVLRADHIGSTAVPGLSAKDVIDVQVVVPDTAILAQRPVVEALQRVGLLVGSGEWVDHVHAGDLGLSQAASMTHLASEADPHLTTWPKQMIFNADPGRIIHCHVREDNSPAWRTALLFRDWLRAEPAERVAYAELKQQHAAQGLTSNEHAEAKEPWFAQALPRARAWATRQAWAPEQPGD